MYFFEIKIAMTIQIRFLATENVSILFHTLKTDAIYLIR